jgi:diguanylate cyclase (GGDEF)-like protein/PAS domain S-box-containing protein
MPVNNSLERGQALFGFDWMAIYRTVVGYCADLLIVADRTGRFIWTEAANGSIPELRSKEEIYEWIHPEDLTRLKRFFFSMETTCSPIDLTFRFRRMDGEWGWMEAVGIPQSYEEEEFVVITLRDNTVQKQKEEELRHMAFHDSLTGLPNRRLFEEHLSQSIAHAKRNGHLMAVFYLDIDNFKLINDWMGHEMGDLFLIAFAKRIAGCVREIDTFARLGGDEFTILLPIVDSAESVENVARRIMNAIKKGWDIAGARFNTTASIGIALYPSHGTDSEVLLRNVDKAMYEVKSNGRNGFKFWL